MHNISRNNFKKEYMKTIPAIFLLLIVLSAAAVSPGPGNSGKASSGIAFHQGSWDEALELAKKENKTDIHENNSFYHNTPLPSDGDRLPERGGCFPFRGMADS
jgi:hypothetical protein